MSGVAATVGAASLVIFVAGATGLAHSGKQRGGGAPRYNRWYSRMTNSGRFSTTLPAQIAMSHKYCIHLCGTARADGTRLQALLQAVNIVSPALGRFYDSLSAEQKARFNAIGAPEDDQTAQDQQSPNVGNP